MHTELPFLSISNPQYRFSSNVYNESIRQTTGSDFPRNLQRNMNMNIVNESNNPKKGRYLPKQALTQLHFSSDKHIPSIMGSCDACEPSRRLGGASLVVEHTSCDVYCMVLKVGYVASFFQLRFFGHGHFIFSSGHGWRHGFGKNEPS